MKQGLLKVIVVNLVKGIAAKANNLMQTKILLDRIKKDSPFAKAKLVREGETTPISSKSKSIERPKQSEPDIPSEQPIPSPSENIDP